VSGPGGSCYRCSPGIAWVKDADASILVEEESGRAWRLSGLKAAVWDWLVEGYEGARIARFVALARGIPHAEAWLFLETVVEEWAEAGILVGEGNGRDQPGD